MSAHDRRMEKKRRRQKRLEKRLRTNLVTRAIACLTDLEEGLKVQPPASWPGGSDASMAQPDWVKYDLGRFGSDREPGKSKLEQLEARLLKGPFGFLRNLDHWAIEEFFWHGLPGDSWHPIDAFLAHSGDRFPPAAREQLGRWKAARIGLFEIGNIRHDSFGLREWDPIDGIYVGEPFRAIALNIGGVNRFLDSRGQFMLTYVAPWAPAQNLYCAMGYSSMATKETVGLVVPYLGLRHPEIMARPLPWKTDRVVAKEHWRRWQIREWYGWLRERLEFPFRALIQTPVHIPVVHQVLDLLPSTPEQARTMGIYFQVEVVDGEGIVAGATAVTPIDIASPNLAALAEYHAFRDRVGPPPGVRDQPSFIRLR